MEAQTWGGVQLYTLLVKGDRLDRIIETGYQSIAPS